MGVPFFFMVNKDVEDIELHIYDRIYVRIVEPT